MTNSRNIGWYGLSRQAIPGVMMAMEQVRQQVHTTPEAAFVGSADIAVGFDLDEPLQSRSPRLAVIPNAKVPELLSWLHTFSRETFPLSQYCRVLTLSDWSDLSGDGRPHLNRDKSYLWASIVAGEMLGQAEAVTQVTSASLGWAHSCVTYAVARTRMVYDQRHADVNVSVVERLVKCEADQAFQRKPISLKALSQVWPYADRHGAMTVDLADAVRLAVDSLGARVAPYLRNNSNLASSSAERRVQGFDEVISAAKASLEAEGNDSAAMAPMLAAAAFLVGSGTSHISLLEPHARKWPETYVWFGLLAGIVGPTFWDPAWLRLVKGVERLLMPRHEISDAPQVDLSWVEYAWLSQLTTAPLEVYTEILKQNTRSLIVEFVPGVACQFKLAGGLLSKTEAIPVRGARAVAPAVSAQTMAKILELVTDLQALLSAEASGPAQKRLFAAPSPAPAPKARIFSKKTGAKSPSD